MWATMMALMMLPGAVPAIARRPAALARIAFSLAYLLVWTGFGVGAGLVQWWLARSALLSGDMMLPSSIAAGITVIAVGAYQVTPWKRRFLLECRSSPPKGGRTGAVGALGHGLRYGVACLGSTAALTALTLVVGTTSYPWMAGIALWVLAEKSLPWGLNLPRAAAAGLLGWGGLLLAWQR
jgi:predicted metal-binding membrane protein